MLSELEIGGRKIGPNHPCFIIAEAGVNHNGEISLATQLVDAAVRAGADAVKFQSFKAERLATSDAPKAEYQKVTTGSQESHFNMLQRLELTPSMHYDLIEYCQEMDIQFLSSPFEEESADFLESLGVPAFKIPSGEITNLPFLAHVAKKGKPMIVSTGMANLSETEAAVQTIKEAGNPDLVLLHCLSNYPADPAGVNLRAMETMSKAFGVPVGYSDHTPGTEIALAAVALGATVLEKHFTLDVNLPGPDHQASLEPHELSFMVRGARTVESAMGHGRKEPTDSEAGTADVARKSLVAGRAISAGDVLTEGLIKVKRPGTGLPPAMLPYILGRKARAQIPADALVTLDLLE